MTDTATTRGSRQPANGTTYNPIAGQTFPIGTPVVQSMDDDGTVIPGLATSTDTTYVMGIAAGAGVAGNRVPIQYAGPISLTTAQWDAITGDVGGLTVHASYFLDVDAPGKLSSTTSNTPGDFIAYVGRALSATDLMIIISLAKVVP